LNPVERGDVFHVDLNPIQGREQAGARRGVEVNLAMHFDNIQMIKEAVALGQGISILPARTMQAEIERGRLVAVKLNAPGLARPVGIVHRRRKKFNRATERLLAMLMASPA
jgi:DNA-binding transcriptional LysR family regulator